MVSPYPVAYRRGAAKYSPGPGPSNAPGQSAPQGLLDTIIDNQTPLLDQILDQPVSHSWEPLNALDYVLDFGGGMEPPGKGPRFSGSTALSRGVGILGAAYAAYEVMKFTKEMLEQSLQVLKQVSAGFDVPTGWILDCEGSAPASGTGAPYTGGSTWATKAGGQHPSGHWCGVVTFATRYASAAQAGPYNVGEFARWGDWSGNPVFMNSIVAITATFKKVSATTDVPTRRLASQVLAYEAPETLGTVFEQPIGQLAPDPKTYAKPQPESPWHEVGYGPSSFGGGGNYLSRPRREGRGERGSKFGEKSAIGRALLRYSKGVGYYDAATEACDLVEVMYDSLPDSKKLKYQKGRVITCSLRAQQVYKEWAHIDWNAFVDNWLKNELEDQIVGRTAGTASKGFRQASGRQLIGGLTSGPAL